MPHQFKSIKNKGGLAVHLNETRSIHRNFGYKTFRVLRVAKLNVTNMARAFNVTFDTMKDWWAIDAAEQTAKKLESDSALEELHKL